MTTTSFLWGQVKFIFDCKALYCRREKVEKQSKKHNQKLTLS